MIRRTGLRIVTALLLVLTAVAMTGCGSSPTSPGDSSPHEIQLSGFTVGSGGHFAGFGPDYGVCGTIRLSSGVTDVIVLHDMTTLIRDASGQPFLTWSAPSFFTRLSPEGPTLAGCFTSRSDPVPTRGLGATFLVRITYSRVTGPSRLIESSGAITSR